MSKKGGNFFEEHIEKIVLIIVGLVCITLLGFFVFVSPNKVLYDGKKRGSGDLDIHISKQADSLKYKLNSKPMSSKPYELRFPILAAFVDSAISNIDTGMHIPSPINSSKEMGPMPKYTLPAIGEVHDIVAERFRAVVYIPQATPQDALRRGYEPNDLDFVTVEAKFDVAGLVENFYESFAGDDVNEEWRDPCLAEPVFAAVQLQRQELDANGLWNDWQIVPRTKIDPRREMFEIIEDVESAAGTPKAEPGGIKVRLLQFDDPQVRMDLLQPEPYQIASAKEEWFPPSLHKKYVERQNALETQEKRERLEAKKQEREQQREKVRAERSKKPKTETRTQMDGIGKGLGMGMGMGMGPGMGMGMGPAYDTTKTQSARGRLTAEKRERGVRRERKERRESARRTADLAGTKEDSATLGALDKELDELLITEDTSLAGMAPPLGGLMFWAHDDTIEPKKTYRYRIRLGVFNPLAGTEHISESRQIGKHNKDNVILWSGFSELTEPVEVPGKLYFFPVDIQETTEQVTIHICRYLLGYWYGQDFLVRRGEVIGRAVESESPATASGASRGGGTEGEQGAAIPETIDYSTSAVLVDVVRMSNWVGGKNMRARHYFDMLYSFDVSDIKRMPVKKRYWPRELQTRFDKIRELEKEPREPLRPMGSKRERRRLPQQPQPGQFPGMFPGMFPGEMPMMPPGQQLR